MFISAQSFTNGNLMDAILESDRQALEKMRETQRERNEAIEQSEEDYIRRDSPTEKHEVAHTIE